MTLYYLFVAILASGGERLRTPEQRRDIDG